MSTTTISERKSFPVRRGDATLYCDGFKASAVRTFTEAVTVSGGSTITNNAPKAMKLILRGRVVTTDTPMRFVVAMNAMLHSAVFFDVTVRGMRCEDSILQAFTVEDVGSGYLEAAVTLVVTEISEVNEVSE